MTAILVPQLRHMCPIALLCATPVLLALGGVARLTRSYSSRVTLLALGLPPLAAVAGMLALSRFALRFTRDPALDRTWVVFLGGAAVWWVPVALLLGRRLVRVRARAHERRSDSARRDLVIWISRDLSAPVAEIQAMSEALADGVVSNLDQTGRYLRCITQEAERLVGMVDDLLELSQITPGVPPWSGLTALPPADIPSRSQRPEPEPPPSPAQPDPGTGQGVLGIRRGPHNTSV
jgi:signal transduction histidine kinase